MDQDAPSFPLISEPYDDIVPGLVFRILMEQPGSRGQLVLVIDEYTDFDAVGSHRWEINEIQRKLNTVQGTDLNYKYQANIYALHLWHEEGLGWSSMTMLLNYICHVLTVETYQEERTRGRGAKRVNRPRLDTSTRPYLAQGAAVILHFTYTALGKRIEDLDAWMAQAQSDLDEQRWSAVLADQPFGEGHVRDKVRYFEKLMKAGKITVPEKELGWNILESVVYSTSPRGSFAKTDEVLDRQDSSEWRRNKAKLQEHITSIVKKWDESDQPRIAQFRELTRKSGKT